MAQTPSAHARNLPSPRSWKSSRMALVIGKKTCFWARMIESLTSSIAKANASRAPARRLAAMRGSVTLIIALSGRAAEVLGGLLEGDARLLETGRGRAHDVGEPADRVGDDEQHGRVAHRVDEREEAALLGHREVAEGQHDPGHGERQHRQEVEDAAGRRSSCGRRRRRSRCRGRRRSTVETLAYLRLLAIAGTVYSLSERRAVVVEREPGREDARVPVPRGRDQDAPRDGGGRRRR